MEPQNCFVAIFDILGFKNLRKEKSTAGIYRLFNRAILPQIEHAAAGSGKSVQINGEHLYVPNFNSESIKYRFFSDTVIFYTTDNSQASLIKIVNSSDVLLRFGLSGGYTPFRGAIGYGDLIYDPNGILIGSAIEDAHKSSESQFWSGCTFTKNCEEYLLDNLLIDLEHFEKIVRYQNIPVFHNPKTGKANYHYETGLVINWVNGIYAGAGEKGFCEPQDETEGADHIKKIIEETIKFETWARESKNKNP